MNRKVVSFFLAVIVLFSMISFVNAETVDEIENIEGSSYLDSYGASLLSPGVTGKLDLVFHVYATHDMEAVGVLGIIVRNNNGTIHQIILGSTANGLLDSGTWFHLGDYRLDLTSGNTYYCSVIIVARDANGSDSRTVTTQHVVCP